MKEKGGLRLKKNHTDIPLEFPLKNLNMLIFRLESSRTHFAFFAHITERYWTPVGLR